MDEAELAGLKPVVDFVYRGFRKRGVYCELKGGHVTVRQCRRCRFYNGLIYGHVRCRGGGGC